MFNLVGVGPVFQQSGPEHGNAERDQRLARADFRHLLAHDFRLFRIEASAAIFLRPMRDGPALVAHPLEPDALRLRGEFCVAAAPEAILIPRHLAPPLPLTIRLPPRALFADALIAI